MSDKDDDALWSEVGAALTPRRSEAGWSALRRRVLARVAGPAPVLVRPWVVAGALSVLGVGLIATSRLTQEPAPVEVAAVSWDTRLTAVEGLVTVLPSGRSDEVAATVGLPIMAGDLIRVGPEGRAELTFSDKGLVSLGPSTVLQVGSLDQRQSFLDLAVGSLVAKLDWHGDGMLHGLAVRTPAAVAAVRGTEFGVIVGADGGTSVGVFDRGRVAVTTLGAPSVYETMLTPNQEVRVPYHAAPETMVRGNRNYLRPGGLKELSAYRPVLDSIIARQPIVRGGWKPMSRAERESTRRRLFSGAPRAAAPAPASAPAPDGRSAAGAAPQRPASGSPHQSEERPNARAGSSRAAPSRPYAPSGDRRGPEERRRQGRAFGPRGLGQGRRAGGWRRRGPGGGRGGGPRAWNRGGRGGGGGGGGDRERPGGPR